MARALTIAAATFALGSCAMTRVALPPPAPGYTCSAASQMDHGELRATRALASDGTVQRTYIIWTSTADKLSIFAIWDADGGARTDFDRGLIMFDWDVVPLGSRHTYPDDRLELRVRRGPPWDSYAKFEGATRLQAGVRLSADWADIAAMAQGAPRLYLLLKNRKGVVLGQRVLERSVFASVRPAGERLLAQIDKMIIDYHTACQLQENLDNIIIT